MTLSEPHASLVMITMMATSILPREYSRLESEFHSLWRDHARLYRYESLHLRGSEHPATDELVSIHFLTIYWTGYVYLYTTMRMLCVMAGRGEERAQAPSHPMMSSSRARWMPRGWTASQPQVYSTIKICLCSRKHLRAPM